MLHKLFTSGRTIGGNRDVTCGWRHVCVNVSTTTPLVIRHLPPDPARSRAKRPVAYHLATRRKLIISVLEIVLDRALVRQLVPQNLDIVG